MLLSEILEKPIKGIRQSSRGEFDWDYESNDYVPPPQFDLLGWGIATTAHHHPTTNKVVKYTRLKYQQQDPMYQFMRLAYAHQSNPYFPKIYNIKSYGKAGYMDKLVATVEKALPLTQQGIQQWFTLLGTSHEEFAKSGANSPDEFLVSLFKDPMHRAKIKSLTSDPHLKQALRLLEPLFQHYSPDMHTGNIMVRSDGHLIIMDPVS
jgi:hypothetical protein